MRSRGGTGINVRSLASTFVLQIRRYLCVSSARACPTVLSLVYPSRTRGVLSVLKTDYEAGCFEPGLDASPGTSRAGQASRLDAQTVSPKDVPASARLRASCLSAVAASSSIRVERITRRLTAAAA
jgi:hypothetical protein